MYGFIVRNSREFTNPKCLKQLYVSYVRSLLDYASIVWCPFYECYKYAIEKVQNKVVRYIYFKERGIYNRQMNVATLCQGYGLESLENRRRKFCILYLYQAINGHIDDPIFVSKLNLYVPPYNTRDSITFYMPDIARTNRQHTERCRYF